MRKINFLSKSSSQSCGHDVVTLASAVGSQEEFYVSGGNSRGAFTPADVCQTSSVRLNRFTAHRRGIMLQLLSVLVLIFTFGIGQMWGADPTHTTDFTKNCSFASGTQNVTVNSATWTVTTTVGSGSPSLSFGNTYGNGALIGGASASKYYSTIKLTTSYFSTKNVKKVEVSLNGNTSVSKTVSAKQGSTTIGSEKKNVGTSWATYTCSGTAGSGGDLEVTITSGAASTAINSIIVTYTEGGTTHTLDKAVSPANSGSVELGATSLVESTGQTTATATANTGYVFNYWTISGTGATMSNTTDGKSTDNPVTVTMGTANATVTANFLQQVKTPTFSEGTGTYNNYKDITLSCETSGATIRYTTNNTEPTSTSTEYTGAITVNATGTVIRAKAFKDGMAASAEASATYTLTCTTPALTTGGTFNTNQSVEITCGTTDAVVRYTTNGNDPTESSAVYSEAISVTQTTTIKAKAFKSGMNASSVASATYTLKCEAPTFEVEAGTYTGAQTVAISSTTPGVTIRYTTNGSNPSTTSGTVYSEPITVSSSQTVKAIAYKENWSASTVVSAAYTIQYYITWNDNGGQIGEKVLVNSGSTNYTCPSDPSLEERGNCGNRFMGWTNTSDYAGNEPPTILFTNSTGTKPAVNSNMDFYAVFADYTKE